MPKPKISEVEFQILLNLYTAEKILKHFEKTNWLNYNDYGKMLFKSRVEILQKNQIKTKFIIKEYPKGIKNKDIDSGSELFEVSIIKRKTSKPKKVKKR